MGKQHHPYTKNDCETFISPEVNGLVNPRTNRSLRKSGPTRVKIIQACADTFDVEQVYKQKRSQFADEKRQAIRRGRHIVKGANYKHVKHQVRYTVRGGKRSNERLSAWQLFLRFVGPLNKIDPRLPIGELAGVYRNFIDQLKANNELYTVGSRLGNKMRMFFLDYIHVRGTPAVEDVAIVTEPVDSIADPPTATDNNTDTYDMEEVIDDNLHDDEEEDGSEEEEDDDNFDDMEDSKIYVTKETILTYLIKLMTNRKVPDELEQMKSVVAGWGLKLVENEDPETIKQDLSRIDLSITNHPTFWRFKGSLIVGGQDITALVGTVQKHMGIVGKHTGDQLDIPKYINKATGQPSQKRSKWIYDLYYYMCMINLWAKEYNIVIVDDIQQASQHITIQRVGVNVPCELPEWISDFMSGWYDPQNNPKLFEKGKYEYDVCGMYRSDTDEVLRRFSEIRELSRLCPFEVDEESPETMTEFISNTRWRVAVAGWKGHSRLLIKNHKNTRVMKNPGKFKTILVLDPWKQTSIVRGVGVLNEYAQKKGWTMVAIPREHSEQAQGEGSCVLVSLARAIFIAVQMQLRNTNLIHGKWIDGKLPCSIAILVQQTVLNWLFNRNEDSLIQTVRTKTGQLKNIRKPNRV